MRDRKRASTAEEAWSDYEILRQDLITLREGIKEVREAATSPDGLVTATVGSRGELLDLSLDPRIYRTTDSAALAETIKATVKAAAGAASAQMIELARPFLPAPTSGGSA